jgi:hypothetical protein
VRRSAAFLALVAALGLTVVGAAVAVPPDHHTDSQDYSGASSCGSFDDVYQGHLDASIVSTFDQAGNPVRDIVHITGWEINSRSDMPSVSLTARRNFIVIFDYQTRVERDLGNIYTQTVPGYGLLFHDVGLISLGGGVVTVHGPHDVFEQGDAAFCNALAAVTPG